MLYIIVAALGGATIVLSRIFSARLGSEIGLVESSFFNYFFGLTGSILLGLSSGEIFKISAGMSTGSIPGWAYMGGLIGLCVVLLSNALTPKMSNLYMTLFVFLGQLASGLVIDLVNLGQLPVSKIVGGLLVLAGLCYNLYLDQKSSSKASSIN